MTYTQRLEFRESEVDPLAQFLDAATYNTEQSYFALRDECDIFREIMKNFETLSEVQDGIEGERAIAAHMCSKVVAYALSAIRIAMAGQPAEAMPSARASIETALYIFQMTRPRDLAEVHSRTTVYLKRYESAEGRNATRRMFGSPSTILHEIENINGPLGRKAKKVYESVIDLGAHPNAKAVTPFLSPVGRDEETGRQVVTMQLLVSDPITITHGIRAVTECALVGLSICGYAFQSRPEIGKLSKPITALWKRIRRLPPIEGSQGETP